LRRHLSSATHSTTEICSNKMPRWAPRVDRNQKEIVAKLRQCGVSVLHMHGLGGNAPDIICAWRGINVLFEIKNPLKRNKGSKGGMEPEAARIAQQKAWLEAWPGPCAMIYTWEEAMNFLSETATINQKRE